MVRHICNAVFHRLLPKVQTNSTTRQTVMRHLHRSMAVIQWWREWAEAEEGAVVVVVAVCVVAG